ncbi:putative metal-binding protein [Mariniflexile fucanivorans]|uniref:Putative metal-binding protein n=1 Tax=Mariniflexile fucanivorans TaxID=264023 RepID=A0A4R1RBL2_9FLAO|nr:DUF1847 domain-containing protein [Mariniflexile fucanivorans]TCL63175.1 putative metal-binding protein [Mariniflexile fucanivorans]
MDSKIYTKEFQKIMQANCDYTSMRANRIEEILNFARGMHVSRLGIAHCITFSHEAEVLKEYFSKYFTVYTVGCKHNKVRKKEILGGESNRIMCNPAGQADILNSHGTELNISMGLCVGHDMIFSKKSNGLVTNLFDKDFTNNNNPSIAFSEIEKTL